MTPEASLSQPGLVVAERQAPFQLESPLQQLQHPHREASPVTTVYCFVCADQVQACNLSSHLIPAHGWANCSKAASISENFRISFYFWRFGFSTQCLDVLKSCDTRQEYLQVISLLPQFNRDCLVLPPGFSTKYATIAEKKSVLTQWRDNYHVVEEELVKSLTDRQYYDGNAPLFLLISCYSTESPRLANGSS